MAKRLITWEENGSTLEMRKYVKADSEETGKLLESFDLRELFKGSEFFNPEDEEFGFGSLSEVQKFIFIYGLKQKLADAGSAETDPRAKAIIAKEKFQDFVAGKLQAVRANGTGAKENKRVAEGVKKLVGEVSYQGLMVKQAMFPDTFTKEDAEKLEEFTEIMWRHKKEQEGKKEE